MEPPEFADAELVMITWLRGRLGGSAGHVCSELPGPEEYLDRLPIVQVVRLSSPPMANPYALDSARMAVTAHTATDAGGRPAAIALAAEAGAAVQAVRGRTVAVGGGVTVSTVRDQTGPEAGDESNPRARTAGFTCVVLLRPT